MTNPSKQYKDRPVPTTEEIDLMLSKADKIDNEYFKLRAKAVLCLISVFGRRSFDALRQEIAGTLLKARIALMQEQNGKVDPEKVKEWVEELYT